MSGRSVVRLAFRKQLSDFGFEGQIRQRWPSGIAFVAAYAVENRWNIATQPDAGSGVAKQFSICRFENDSAAASDDGMLAIGQFDHDRGLAAAKTGFALLREDLGDGSSDPRFDFVIGIDEMPAKLRGKQAADG